MIPEIVRSEAFTPPPPVASPKDSLHIVKKNEIRALISRDADFWLLGGFSILAWILSLAAVQFGHLNIAFDRQVANWPYVFSALTLICNNPHFLMSYRLAYAKHPKKIWSHWFSLIAVPLTLICLLVTAFCVEPSTYSAPNWLMNLDARWPNPVLDTFAHTQDLGNDMLRIGVWLMWILVGWHYSKQVFGVMIKYAKFDSYPLSKKQKNIIRLCLLAVIPTNFIGFANQSKIFGTSVQDLKMIAPEFSNWTLSLCYIVDGALFLLFSCMIIQNFVANRKLPSVNFLIPFVAFYLWWMPGLWPQPFAVMMVPFFHSLQYLSFSYKRLEGEMKTSKQFNFGFTLNILAILVGGYLIFDLVPTWMDDSLHTRFNFGSSFFLIATAIFVNVHHFFIDSVIWKGKAPQETI